MHAEHRDDHRRTPYADALRAHADRDPLMLMVPGHGATATGMSEELADFLGERAVRLDIPQLVDGIDVGPGSPFDQAVDLASDAWRARRTWFLANGSSQGNRMAIIAAFAGERGSTLLAQRSAHSSLIDGLIVAGAMPDWLLPTIDHERGINHGITPDALEHALEAAEARGERPCAVYIISPSYFGAIADIPRLSRIAHAHNIPLIVDAAWGAHFGFHDALPAFPTTEGADIVVTSLHKMGGSLGQSAMLHLADGPFADELESTLDRAHNLTQTTSVSSLLLASLDIARKGLVTRTDLIGESLLLAERLREWVRDHPQLKLVSDDFADYPDIVGSDPLRVSIDVALAGLTGYEMRAELSREHGIFVEIATLSAVVAFFGPGKPVDLGRLTGAIQEIVDRAQGNAVPDLEGLALPTPGARAMSPRDAYFAETEIVPRDEAVGRVSVDALAAYPPGIPNIAPGETITEEAIEFLRAVAASPIGHVRGAIDPELSSLRVVR